MYYQVLIETINDKTKEPKEIYELDIPSKNSVLNETVLPYLLTQRISKELL